MRRSLQDFQGDTYERPNQSWVCGLNETGEACPSGPGKGGRCPLASACHPVQEGDRWRCNRSAARGGACEEGPTPDGECCHVYRCKPIRSLRSRRGRFVLGCFVATLGGLCLMLSSPTRNDFLAPGKLSVHHAQLLERSGNTDRCASCHAAGTEGLGSWITRTFAKDDPQTSQTSLCLKCHDKQFSRELADVAHNVDLHTLLGEKGDFDERLFDPREPLACATCHQEHHGADHDLAWMSDQSCQACHQEQYDSFATDHPEFNNWPTNRRTRIAFDHVSHEVQHFPQENQTYSCNACHQQDQSGAFQETLNYAQACASCHDRKIKSSWENGFVLFQLPMLDVETLEAAGHDVGPWPKEATGEFDGSFSPITKLLIARDEKADKAFQTLGHDFDFYDVDPDDPQHLQAAAELIRAAKWMYYDFSTRGHDAVKTRLKFLLRRELTDEELADLTSRLSPENLQAITQKWLPNLSREFGESRSEDSDAASRLPQQDVEQARSQVAYGGWIRNDTTLSIHYVPTGHADPWVTSWIDVIAEATQGKHASLAESLLLKVMEPTAPGQCGSCHSIDRTENGLQVQWHPKSFETSASRFTRFSHGPHVIQANLADCTSCHRTLPESQVMKNYSGHNPHAFDHGFEPLTKASCAECHTPGAAGDSCLQCHQYHVGPLPPE